MIRQRIARTAMLLVAITPLGFTLQEPPPRPDPAPAPQPAPADTAQQERERQERERQERLDRERRERQDRENRQAEERRRQQAEDQRMQQERDRAARARETARTREGSATRRTPMTNEMRATARNLFEVERVHRSHIARIERLKEIYMESGDRAKVSELEQLEAKANTRYQKFVARYKEEMGPAFSEVQPHLEAGQARTTTRPRRDNDNQFGNPSRQRNPNTTGGGQ